MDIKEERYEFDVLEMYSEVNKCNTVRLMEYFLRSREFSVEEVLNVAKDLDTSLPYLVEQRSGFKLIKVVGLSKETIAENIRQNFDKVCLTDYFPITWLYSKLTGKIVERSEIAYDYLDIYFIINKQESKKITYDKMYGYIQSHKGRLVEILKNIYTKEYIINYLL